MDNNLIQIITKHDENYKSIGLKCVNDKSLSWKAKGIHLYLLSRPGNWMINQTELVKRSTDGISSLHSGISELIKAGYLYRVVKRNEKKQIIKWGFLIFEEITIKEEASNFLNNFPEWGIIESKDKENLLLGNLFIENPTSREPIPIINSNIKNKELIKDASKEASTDPEGSGVSQIKIRLREKESSDKRKLFSEAHNKREPLLVKKCSQNVKDIISFWAEQGLKLPSKGTKSYNECIDRVNDLLNGRQFRESYTVDQIKNSIINFSLAALDSDFAPANIATKRMMARLSIKEFIYNGYRKVGTKSYFKTYLDSPPTPLPGREVVENKFPLITRRLKKFYEDQVLGNAKVSYTQRDENQFRLGAIKLKQFYEKNKERFNKFMVIHDVNLSDWLCESVKADCNGDTSRINPGWFASEMTFNRRLPSYLFRQNVIEDKNNTYQQDLKPIQDDISKFDDLQIPY